VWLSKQTASASVPPGVTVVGGRALRRTLAGQLRVAWLAAALPLCDRLEQTAFQVGFRGALHQALADGVERTGAGLAFCRRANTGGL